MSEQWEEFIPQDGDTWPVGVESRYRYNGQAWGDWRATPSIVGTKILDSVQFDYGWAFRRPAEMIPLKLCVDLLMENIRTIDEFRHLAIPNQGLIILGHFVISDTSSDLRSKVKQTVREMTKGGSDVE